MYVLVASPCFASTLSVITIFFPPVGLIRLLGNLFGYFVQVTGPFPLPAVFLARSRTLPFSYLAAANILEALRVFFLALARRISPSFLIHRSLPCLRQVLRHR
jgi:hypothetical protein